MSICATARPPLASRHLLSYMSLTVECNHQTPTVVNVKAKQQKSADLLVVISIVLASYYLGEANFGTCLPQRLKDRRQPRYGTCTTYKRLNSKLVRLERPQERS